MNWKQIKRIATITVAVSGAILGLPVLIPTLVLPAAVLTIAASVGGLATAVVKVVDDIQKDADKAEADNRQQWLDAYNNQNKPTDEPNQ
jgi:4-hydroxybenzoate polyprenyltransferase